MSELDDIRADLTNEQLALDLIVSQLNEDQWQLATPSPGWNVGDQIAHLTYFDGTAALAVQDPDAFSAGLGELFAAATSVGIDEFTLGTFRRLAHQERLEAWRMNRARLAAAANELTDQIRVPWYGPSMGAKSFLTARLMEVWAHGTDIVDAVDATRPGTDRLRHIVQLGYITRAWSYSVRGLSVPSEPVRLELLSPSGATWRYGPDDALEVVTGSAEEFCLVVTQRRHVADTSLVATPIAMDWLVRAQAFAGGPTDPPRPKERS
jgi:uncharacterized protein (TIGR03084 family)